MKALIQRVNNAQVQIDNKIISQINLGMLVFIGIEKLDDYTHMDKMVKRLLTYRIFNDNNQKMNLSVVDIAADILLVSQFTLAANTNAGARASFSSAKEPKQAQKLYDYFVDAMHVGHDKVASGVFGADMQITLTNDGPVTFLLSNS